MSISIGSTATGASQGCYSRAVSFAQKYIKPRVLDAIEYLIVLNTTCGSSMIAAMKITGYEYSFFSAKDVVLGAAIAGGAMAVGFKSLMEYQKRIKSPYVQKQMEIFIESSKNNPKSILIFRTSGDPFEMCMSHIAVSHFQKFAKKHSIELLAGKSKLEIQQNMLLNTKKYDRILFEAHSSSESITIAPDTIITKNSQKTIKWLNDHIEYGGIIALKCCSAGQGDDNIAREISLGCPHAFVYASSEDISALQGFEFDDDWVPSFNDGSLFQGKDTTRIYRNGILLNPSQS